jgi:predicted MFS family arabinose efflux permease
VVIGLALAGCLYETCFAFLTLRLGSRARAAITRVTLVAGFAGTLAFPLGHYLGRELGGQGALWPFAGLVLVAAGLNAVAGRMLRQEGGRATAPEPAPGVLRVKLRTVEFWALAVGFGLIYLNHGILVTYVVVLFQDRGVGADMASLAAACIGPAQVAGRLALMVNEARVVNLRAYQLSIGAILVASLLLFAAGAQPLLVFGVALMQGAGMGLISILRPVLVAEVLGRRGFGAISGAVAVAPILASAAAPSVGALVLEGLGQGAVYGLLAVLAGGALALGLWLRVRTSLARV